MILILVVAASATACRKRKNSDSSTATVGGSAAVAPVDGAAGGTPAYATPPPVTSAPPVSEAARFNAPQPTGMYAPAYSGDYQAQLDAYNRVLRKWMEDSSNAPRTLQEIMNTFNSPKPPTPPAGRQLIYDPATKRVRLQ